ncbi:MAG TPA: histidine kinase dimerization/phospho-acceptor domain-containing protein, partial [Casimicrobiaceae bacterium]
MKHWGIRARVLFLALAPGALILFTLLIYFTYTRIAAVDTALARQGVSIARQLASAAEFAVFARDRVALQRLADAAAREENVSTVHIRDAAGHELARSTGERAITDTEKLVAFAYPVVETRLSTDIPERLHVPDQDAIGEIVVSMSRQGAQAEQRHLLAIGLTLGFGCMIAAVLLAMVIGNGVVRPIRGLAQALRDFGAGARVPPLDVSGGGELRALNEGFNEMVGKLAAGTEELQARIAAATRELSEQRDTAQEATAAKSRFIAAASHDLRQPLHALGMFSQALAEHTHDADGRALVQRISASVSALEALLSALLDVSKLDAGVVVAHPRDFAIRPLLDRLADECMPHALERGLSLAVVCGDVAVRSDPMLLERILRNFLTNALRYTERGGVVLGCRRRG